MEKSIRPLKGRLLSKAKGPLILVPLVLNLSACNPDFSAQKPKADEQAVVDTQSIKSEKLEEFIKVNVQPGDAEKYTIQFSWPHIEENKQVRIRMGKALVTVPSTESAFNHEVSHDQVLTYSFEVLDSASAVERTFQKQVKVPKDFVVRPDQREITSDQKLTVNRLFLGPDVSLLTYGHKVDIVADEIRSAMGTIETLPAGSRALEGHPGVPNGDLTITASKIFGKLKIVMRGQNGSIGDSGMFKPRAAGGGPSGYGDVIEICHGKESDVCGDRCVRKGPNAGAGANGEKGYSGGRGYPGGSTGSVKVTIQKYIPLDGVEKGDAADSVVSITQFPGIGGPGGDGGSGQMGGPGGPVGGPGSCWGDAGPDGQNGLHGDRGPKGIDGDVGQKCIYIGSEKINECIQ